MRSRLMPGGQGSYEKLQTEKSINPLLLRRIYINYPPSDHVNPRVIPLVVKRVCATSKLGLWSG